MKAKQLEYTEYTDMQHTPVKNFTANPSSENSPQRTNIVQVVDSPLHPIIIGSTDSPARKPGKEILYIVCP
jgi:hypothetical protein